MAENNNNNIDVNKTNLGMNLNTREGELQEQEYKLAVNANILSKDGSFFILTNELSNLYCSAYKPGYKVIGVLPIVSLSKTIFFLVNPATNESELGEISNISYTDIEDVQYNCDACNNPTVEDPPLEQQRQVENCNYKTIVNADCLGFNINHPIRSWVKQDDCNLRIYFTDNTLTGLRYVDYDYQKRLISNCPILETTELDCDKIKVFRDTCYPKIEYNVVRAGGENKAGTVQFAISYSDAQGTPIGHYFFVTNPIPLFDQPISVLTDYVVNQIVQLSITDLSQEFLYFNLAVIKTVNLVSSAYLVATLSVTSQAITYNYTGNERNIIENLSIEDILARYPYYTKAELITESNGYLMWANLEQERVWNLQPAINQLRLKWQTVEMDEGDYKNPVFHAKYRGVLRDEVYPYAIEFVKKNGTNTPAYHIPAPTKDEVNALLPSAHPVDEIIHNTDVIKVDNCAEPLNHRWQVYNTTPQDQQYACNYQVPEVITTLETEDIICNSYLFGGIKNIPQPTTCWTTSDPETQELCYEATLRDYPPILEPLPLVPYAQYTIVVIPSYTYTQCFYPGIDNYISPAAPIPAFTRVEETQLANPDRPEPNAWILPTNLTTGTSTFIEVRPDATCSRASGLYTYGYLSYVASPTTAGVDCIGTSVSDDNAVWFNFTATSNNHAISCTYIGFTDLIVQVYDTDGVTLLGCADSTNFYYLVNNTFPYNIGSTYFIKVFNTDPTFGGNPDLVNIGWYFDICVNTPVGQEPCVEVPVSATYALECKYKISYYKTTLVNTNCVAVPYKTGSFGYWESSELYPCNEEVWAELANTPIRHHRFPDFNISPFYENATAIPTNSTESFKVKNKIYPLGVTLDIEQIKQALESAVNRNLITEEEKQTICGYRILRGDRNGNQSIIGKGLLYDVWSYRDNSQTIGNNVLYPNYPYNDLNPDIFLAKAPYLNSNMADIDALTSIFTQKHPYANRGYVNDKYTFHSPETHFNNPSLGTELRLECEQFGYSQGSYNKVLQHSEYQYTGTGLSAAALGFATTEASMEAITSVLQAGVIIDVKVLGTGTTIPLGFILAIIANNLTSPSLIINHYYEWLELLQKLSPYRNYAWFYSSVGRYVNHALPPNYNAGNTRRRIINHSYLGNGVFSVRDNDQVISFNNSRRESSAYLNITDTFKPTTNKDVSRWAPGVRDTSGMPYNCSILNAYRPISSYYASLKNYNPSQYGSINHVNYLDTGYNGIMDFTDPLQSTVCDTIFGGDTFINRFSLKIKHPFFIQERVGTQYTDNSDVVYSELYNVAYPKFFFNYPPSTDSDGSGSNSLFANVAARTPKQIDYNFACDSYKGRGLRDAGVVLGGLSASGAGAAGIIAIPITYNVLLGINLGGGSPKNTPVFINGKMFLYSYGIPSFLVESSYNLEYRHGQDYKSRSFYPYTADVQAWTQEVNVPIFEDNFYFYNNTYSKQNRENHNFLLNENYSREKDDCKVVNTNRIIYSLRDGDNNDNNDGNLIYPVNNYYDVPKVGGNIKQIKGLDNNSVLVIQEDMASVYNSYVELQTNKGTSFVGSGGLFTQQPTQYRKTDLGFGGTQHSAFASTPYGNFYVDAKRGNLLKYTQGIPEVIAEKTAFSFFKENLPFKIIKDYPTVDINNNFKFFGISMAYDERFKRIFITKRDHQVKPEFKRDIVLIDQDFFYNDTLVKPTDTRYFINKCWTVAYSPLEDSLISFYTFLPNYYVPTTNYFSTGVNYIPNVQHQEGLWSHLLTNKSYQVFYGYLHPFMVEYQTPNNISNHVLNAIAYQTDVKRYINQYDYYLINNKTFTQALIYNQNQSSGILNLIPKEKNNFYQSTQYPKISINSTDILTENIENQWRFNSFQDLSQNNNQPLLKYISNPMYKESNILSLSYFPKYLTVPLRSDYFNVRLENNVYSNYQYLFKYQINQQTNSL